MALKDGGTVPSSFYPLPRGRHGVHTFDGEAVQEPTHPDQKLLA